MKWTRDKRGAYVSDVGGWRIIRMPDGWCLQESGRFRPGYPTLAQAKALAEHLQPIREQQAVLEKELRSERAKKAWRTRRANDKEAEAYRRQREAQERPQTHRPGQRYRSIDDE